MNPNARKLALRDSALAALVGAETGADFGIEFGDDYSGGADYGIDFGADAPVGAPVNPTALVRSAQMQAHVTQRRLNLIEPNKDSKVKIERYSFALNATLTLGAASAINMSGNPDTHLRPQRVMMNAPSPGFATISEIKVANVSATSGGSHDAFDFSPVAVGSHLDLPTLSPANRAQVLGNYTGFVPPGFVGGAAFTFVASFKGPALITA